jgi:hypothetical protein
MEKRVKQRGQNDLPPVRILPMSDRIEGFAGRSIEQVQAEFFLNRFVRSNGQFHYCTSGLNALPGTPVLFQFKGRAVATAIFLRDDRFNEPSEEFAGVLQFDPKSIRTFEPLNAEDMRKAWPGFRAFGHVKQKLNPGGWRALERILKNVRSAK